MKREVEVGGTIAMQGQVRSQIRTVLEGFLYELAVQHMRRALRERRCRGTGAATNEEMRNATIAIVASTACLEAFANAEGARHLGKGRRWKEKRSLAVTHDQAEHELILASSRTPSTGDLSGLFSGMTLCLAEPPFGEGTAWRAEPAVSIPRRAKAFVLQS